MYVYLTFRVHTDRIIESAINKQNRVVWGCGKRRLWVNLVTDYYRPLLGIDLFQFKAHIVS